MFVNQEFAISNVRSPPANLISLDPHQERPDLWDDLVKVREDQMSGTNKKTKNSYTHDENLIMYNRQPIDRNCSGPVDAIQVLRKSPGIIGAVAPKVQDLLPLGKLENHACVSLKFLGKVHLIANFQNGSIKVMFRERLESQLWMNKEENCPPPQNSVLAVDHLNTVKPWIAPVQERNLIPAVGHLNTVVYWIAPAQKRHLWKE